MGLLSFFNRDLQRLKSKKKAFKVFNFAFKHLLPVFYLLGLISLFLLPHPILHDNMRADEKALLIGQVANYFRYEDLQITSEILDATISEQDRAKLIEVYFNEIGLDTSIQSFTYYKSQKIISGTNVQGIFRAPRGEGTEAIVLFAPQLTSNTCTNH